MKDFQQEDKGNAHKYHMDKKRVKENIPVFDCPCAILASQSYWRAKNPGSSTGAYFFLPWNGVLFYN
nr:hypothetical protein [Desulfobacula sp.]